MTIRLYLDEDSSDTDLLKALRLRGVDVQAAVESGMRVQPDEAQLRWTMERQRVLYSFNRRDFYRIHSHWMKAGQNHCGIILGVQQRFSVGEQLRRLLFLMSKPHSRGTRLTVAGSPGKKPEVEAQPIEALSKRLACARIWVWPSRK